MDRTLLIPIAVLVGVAACSEVTDDFVCEVDADCTLGSGATGRCEANQRCSYADTACASGSRYGDLSGRFSDQCTTANDCASSVRAGVRDTCAIRSDGAVQCWGNGSTDLTRPDLPAGAIAQLDLGGAGLCARYGDGSVACASGPATGVVSSSTRDLSIGSGHVCTAASNGGAACWGSNSDGELGNGATSPSTSPANVLGLIDARQVAAGLDSTCAITGTGLWCWGNNQLGQLGQGNVIFDHATSPVALTFLGGATAVTVGDRFACALTNGGVTCWGDNTSGQLGRGTTGGTSDSPTAIADLANIAQITAAGAHICARATNGQVSCWGANAASESGSATAAAINKPTLVVDAANTPILFADIDAGTHHTCGRTTTGAILCWGSNTDGQIGDGTTTTARFPTRSTLACR